MTRGSLNQRRVLMIVTALLLVNSLISRRYAQALGLPLSYVLDLVLVPGTAPFSVVSGRVRAGAYTPVVEPGEQDLAARYAEMELNYSHALAILSQYESEIDRLHTENTELKNSAQMVSYGGLRRVEARVTAYNGDPKHPMLTLDKGSAHGLGPNMAVEWRARLVGVLRDVGPRTARVELITQYGTKMLVTIKSPDAAAVPYQIDDWVQLADDGQTFYVDVPRDLPVRHGDLTHLNDDRYPRAAGGRFVGRVEALAELPVPDPKLKRVVIRPMLDLTRLSRVEVMAPITLPPPEVSPVRPARPGSPGK